MKLLFLSGSFVLGLASPGVATDASSGWAVDRSDRYCALTRQGEGGSVGFALRALPGTSTSQLWLISPSWRAGYAPDPAKVRILLRPSGEYLKHPVKAAQLASGSALIVDELNEQFLGAFAKASALEIESQGQPALRVSLPIAEDAVKAFRACQDIVLQKWGVDVQARASLKALPKHKRNLASLISVSDYPQSAIAARASGETITRLLVGTNGRVVECVAVVSSGHRSLDEKTCEVLRRARFEPAIGADGEAARAAVITRINWIIPR